jgi:hypothetical protein
MEPIKLKGANALFVAPPRWDEATYGPCADLPARQSGDTVATGWKPSPEELALLVAGGYVVLTVFGRQPAVSLHVEHGVIDCCGV